ncbi:MAG: magnesium chelatase [Planctomycetes bacterium]|nr:magnesium chelatase [Planctomycetota bacterium]
MSGSKELVARARDEAGKVVVGSDAVFEPLLVAILSGGHVLLEGVPGTAKTLLARTLAKLLGGDFARIQFTPDLMPSDVSGTSVFDLESQSFRVREGPIFANVVLADEINRAPAKTQSALLEAMQEAQVSIDGSSLALPQPHVVIATQNPVEHEGTYPLPEAALDRFFFRVLVDYLEEDLEVEVLARHRDGLHAAEASLDAVTPILAPDAMEAARAEILAVRMDHDLLRYVVQLAQASREAGDSRLGASPRAAVMLMTAARTLAAVRGRDYVVPDDIQETLAPAWSHRIVLDPGAELDGLLPEAFLSRLLQLVPVPR